MNELGLTDPLYVTIALWLAKTGILTLISGFLAWLGIRAIDVMTPDIHERQRIGESPIASGLFIAGFFILIGLVIHGGATAPSVVGGPVLEYLLDIRRLGLIAASFLVSLILLALLFTILDKATPKISFGKIQDDPIAVGIYVFGYLVFFGLILHAALNSPL
ncbi:DUF350 domain-containing protein [Dehalococcoidia bacterium]|nr:DUF350 domain-containing protein [Dehalococcoidia bacterium]